jgi:hypothetical protein
MKLVDSTVSGGDPSDFYSGVYVGASDGRISDVRVKGANFGLYLAGTTSGWEVTDSSANQGGYAGFYIANENQTSPGTISHNTANNNETYGFWAAERTDGHGNRAKGNGTKNCRRVNCV